MIAASLPAVTVALANAEEAVTLLAADAPRPPKETFERAVQLIVEAAKREPGVVRWTFGRGLGLLLLDDLTSGRLGRLRHRR